MNQNSQQIKCEKMKLEKQIKKKLIRRQFKICSSKVKLNWKITLQNKKKSKEWELN